MKKILVAALLATVSSFASWDYFPVQEWGKGQGRITTDNGLQIRYTAMQNLELFASSERNLLEQDYTLGARYQILPVFAAFLDVGVPIRGGDIGLLPGAQVAMNITEMVAFGAEAELGLLLADDITTMLKVGAEFDINVGAQSQVQLGCDFDILLSGDDHPHNIVPRIGFAVFKGDITLGTSIGINTSDANYFFSWRGIDITVGF